MNERIEEFKKDFNTLMEKYTNECENTCCGIHDCEYTTKCIDCILSGWFIYDSFDMSISICDALEGIYDWSKEVTK